MSQPPQYNRQFSFESFSVNNPTAQQPGTQIDNELNNVGNSINQVISKLSELQRADGKINEAAFDDTSIVANITYQVYQELASQLAPFVESAGADASAALDAKNLAHNSAVAAAAHAAAAESEKLAAQAAASLAQAAEGQVNAKLNALDASTQTAASSASEAEFSKLAAQASADSAAANADFVLSVKTYLDSEYFQVLNAWQNLNDVQNKHQSREHLGVQGDVSHAALYHEFKTTLRYFRPPQAASDVDDADKLLAQWFGLVFNVVTDRFDGVADFLSETQDGVVVFADSGPFVWNGSSSNLPEDFPARYPHLMWDSTVEQRVELLRLKLRSFGVVLTNTMLHTSPELNGLVRWPNPVLDDGNSSTPPPPPWTNLYDSTTPFNWGLSYVTPLQVPIDKNRFLTLEDFARANARYAVEGANALTGVDYVYQYVSNHFWSSISGILPEDTVSALVGAWGTPSLGNPFLTQESIGNLVLSSEINWTGDYDELAVYSAGDGVKYNDSHYVLKVYTGNSGEVPDQNPAAWTKLIPDTVGGSAFDQSLNTTDSVEFSQVGADSIQTGGTLSLNADASLYMGDGGSIFVGNGGITFKDGSVQRTAFALPQLWIDQANTFQAIADAYEGEYGSGAIKITEDGFTTWTEVNGRDILFKGQLNPAGLSPSTLRLSEVDSVLGNNYQVTFAAGAQSIQFFSNGTLTGSLSPYQLLFADGTSQNTAYTGGDAKVASSNTFSAPQQFNVTSGSSAAIRIHAASGQSVSNAVGALYVSIMNSATLGHAVVIENRGGGDCLRIHDSNAPDSTRFAVDKDGALVIGGSAVAAGYKLDVVGKTKTSALNINDGGDITSVANVAGAVLSGGNGQTIHSGDYPNEVRIVIDGVTYAMPARIV